MPPFLLEGGFPLALTRGLADAALLAQFGALLARTWLAAPVLDASLLRRLTRLAALSLLASFLLTLLWLAAESQDMAGSLAAIPLVAQKSLFGHLVLARLALLALAALAALALRHPWPAMVLSAAALATQAGHDHAWAMYDGPSLLLASTALHLLAAGAWLGSLPPLAILVAALPAGQAARAALRFSHLATACVLLLAATALFQATTLVASPHALLNTPYGLVVLAKIALFTLLLAFAALNRFRLTPVLATSPPARQHLLRSIALETTIGLLVILAAGLLTSLPPAMHEPL